MFNSLQFFEQPCGADLTLPLRRDLFSLHLAASNGKAETIELLIAKGCDVKDVAKDGYTPLHLAAQSGNNEVIELLIDKGSDMKAVTEDGITPLHLGARFGNTEAIEMLIAKGSDVKCLGCETFDCLTTGTWSHSAQARPSFPNGVLQQYGAWKQLGDKDFDESDTKRKNYTRRGRRECGGTRRH